MDTPTTQKDIEETSADLAYLAYQLRKTVEKTSLAIEQSVHEVERTQRRRDRWWLVLVGLFLCSVLVDVLLRIV